VASAFTKPERGSKLSTPAPPFPSANPATTKIAVSERKLLRATPATRAPSTSSPPKTATVSSKELLARMVRVWGVANQVADQSSRHTLRGA
jgi:hypothetical protein